MSVLVIAEAGVNHNGDLGRALAMVDAAAAAGADVVKFQTFRTSELVAVDAPMADYQKRNMGGEGGQHAMLKALELSEDDHRALIERCRARGIAFLSTPFDQPSLAFLTRDLGLGTLKIPSGELTNGPLLVEAGRSGCRILLSTGMSTLAEVEDALGALAFGMLGGTGKPDLAAARRDGAALLAQRVTVLHCTTEYPAPVAETNLRAMVAMGAALSLPVGLSDHTPGVAVAVAAAAVGATVIEKHFTLDRSLPGPDHKASLEPDELAVLVRGIRDAEAALGVAEKAPTPSECKNIPIARKSLRARRAIKLGEPFSADNLAVMRPGDGLSPMLYWDWLGRVASRDYAAGEAIVP